MTIIGGFCLGMARFRSCVPGGAEIRDQLQQSKTEVEQVLNTEVPQQSKAEVEQLVESNTEVLLLASVFTNLSFTEPAGWDGISIFNDSLNASKASSSRQAVTIRFTAFVIKSPFLPVSFPRNFYPSNVETIWKILRFL